MGDGLQLVKRRGKRWWMTQEAYNARESMKNKKHEKCLEKENTNTNYTDFQWHQNDTAPNTLSSNFSELQFGPLFCKMVIISTTMINKETKLIMGQNCLDCSFDLLSKDEKTWDPWNEMSEFLVRHYNDLCSRAISWLKG